MVPVAFLFDAEESSTRPGARRFNLSRLLEDGDEEAGDVSDVSPTIRRESRGPPWDCAALRSHQLESEDPKQSCCWFD